MTVMKAIEEALIRARHEQKRKKDRIPCPLLNSGEEPVLVIECRTGCPRGTGLGPRCEPYEEYLYLCKQDDEFLDESGG